MASTPATIITPNNVKGQPGSSDAGGALAITGGLGAATYAGGAVSLTGGAGTTTGAGGAASVVGGAGGNDAVGGAVAVTGGAAERIERRAAQDLELLQHAESAEQPGPERHLLRLAGRLVAARQQRWRKKELEAQIVAVEGRFHPLDE